jgi:hypothetical protein
MSGFLLLLVGRLLQVLTAARGTFETWRRTLKLSVHRGRPEVIGATAKTALLTHTNRRSDD